MKKLWLAAITLLFVVNSSSVFSQCVCTASQYAQGGTVTPISNSTQQVTGIGSGTYVTANVHAGGIYTFSHCSNSSGVWANTQLSGFTTTSGCLFYNDDNGPVCTSTKASAQWTSNFTGLVNVNSNLSSCQGFVGSGAGNSGVLDYRCDGPGNPASFGNGIWSVYAWNAGDGGSGGGSWSTAYSGFLNISSPSFTTTDYWPVTGSPSDAPNYSGCYVGPDNHSWSAKRTNWPCGAYRIDINDHDDGYELLINGSVVSSHLNASGDAHANAWTGVLNSSSTIEFRVSENTGSSRAQITVTLLSPGSIIGGTITANQTICSGGDPAAFTSTSSASGGVGTAYLGGSYTYSWYYLDNCTGSGTLIPSQTGLTYDPPSGLTTTRCYYRVATDACGNDAFASPATVTVVADPTVTAAALTNTNICVGGSSTASVTASGGTGTIGYQWQYFNGTTWNNVVNNTPAGANYTNATTANMGISGITAAGTYPYRCQVTASGSGCNTATSTGASLVVVADPTVSAPTVGTTPICTGGSTTIGVTASNGTGGYTYQWQYDNAGTWVNVTSGLPTGAVYINANTATLTVSGITTVGTYNYRAVVGANGSGCDAVNSSSAPLVIVAAPTLSTPAFTNPSICIGGTTDMSTVLSGGTGTNTYQWQYFNGSTWNNVVNNTPAGATYTNATTPTMTVAGISAVGNYQYRCTATTSGVGCNSATSAANTLAVVADPAISISGGGTFCVSGSSLLTATATGGTVTTSYQWQSSPNNVTFTNIGGATSSTYTTPTVTSTTYYQCIYSSTGSGCGPATSNVVAVTIVPAITNNVIAGYQKFCLNGDPAVITAGVLGGGTGSYTYVWEQSTNGGVSWSPASGTNTNATYDPPFTSSTIRYRRIVSSGVCSSTSNEALILVLPLPQVNSLTQTDAQCYNTSTGTITVTASTSNGSVYYSNNNGGAYQVSGAFTGLAAGSYVVVVRDDSLCTNTYVGNPVVIGQPTDVTHTAVANDASCANVFDGKITITAAGGIPPYTYSLNGGPAQSGNQFTGLASGTYLITVFDNHSCPDTSTITVNNSYAVVGSVTNQTNVSCFGGSDGSITVSLSGGIPPYVYSINGSAFQSTPTFSALPAGVYVITMRDSKGCTDVKTVSITQPGQLTVNVDIVNNVVCYGTATGEIFISVTGGTPGYTYNWSNGVTTQNNLNVAVGTYLVTITDSKGCNAFGSATVSQPLALTVTVASARNLRCNNDNSGSIDLSVNGGVPPYNFNWSNGATTEDIYNLNAGTYYVTVQDANGCLKNDSVVISQPATLSSTITGVNVGCNGSNTGSVDLTVTGGTAPYTYAWNNGANTQDLTNVPAGIYNVIFTDVSGCTGTNSINITQPGSLQLALAKTNASCNGSTNGAIDVTASGGSMPYIYIWNDGVTTEDRTNLPAGTYSITVTDNNGCSASASTVITQPAQPLTATATATAVTCNGAGNGSINVNVAGGTQPYNYLWNDGATTEDRTSLSGGTYTITITDLGGCTAVASATVNEPAALSASATGTNVTCFGGSNGTATLTVTGGNAPYSYLWNNFATTQNLTGLAAGTYTVVVTDSKNCQTITSVTITQPSQLVASGVVTNISCNGANDGAINLTVTGGVVTYSYLWSNGPVTEDQSALAPGPYNVTVTDGNGCTATATFNVTQPQPLAVTAVVSNVTCAGAANGAVNITVTGGTTPYTYSWNNGSTVEDRTGLSGGTYDVTITDAHGCTTNGSYVVNEPTPLVSSIAGTNVTCHGASNGAADLTVSGGTAPYTYQWSTFETTQDLNNIPGGLYRVIITDANGCVKRDSILIFEPTQLTLTRTVTDVQCYGDANGAVDLSVSGATPGYTYVWNNGATTQDLTNLTAGLYTVTVTDANGCTAAISANVTQPTQPLNGTFVAADVTCNGANNGSVNLTTVGGTSPYTYLWTNGATSEDILGVGPGTYTVTVTDAHGCTFTGGATVNEPAPLTASIAGTNVSCYGGNNGAALLTVAGGNPPYSYLWSNFANTQNLVGLTAGTYTVIVTDSKGCQTITSVTITQPAPFTLSALVSNVSCSGTNDGAIDVTPNGGTSPYTYLWSNGAITEDINSLAGGNYSVTATDANGCSVSASYTVAQPQALTLTAVVANVSCAGAGNGAINLTVAGGSAPFTYIWSNGATTEDINGLSAGTFDVTVNDSHSCSAASSFTVTEPNAITSSIVGTNVSCYGGNNGAVDLSVSGGTTPYTYLWSTFQATQDLNGLTAGIYRVIITDANGCVQRDSIVISQPAPLALTIATTNVSCNGANNGTVDLTVTGGTTAYTYLWNNGATTEDLSSLAAGTYTVTVTDANGCTATTSATITQPAQILSATLVPTDVTCNGANNGSVNLSVIGGTTPYTYIWSNGATTKDISGVGPATYTVTITDANGCSTIGSTTVNEPAVLTANIAGTNVSCFGGNNGAAALTVTGGNAPYTYLWSNFATTQNLTNLTAGTYTVIVTDSKGCQAITSVTITQPAPLAVSGVITNVTCNGMLNGAVDVTVTGGTTAYNYLWSNGATTEDLTGVAAGTYTITVIDANGCTATASYTVTQPQPLTLSGVASNVTCNGAANGSVNITLTGGTTAYSYLWSNGATTEDLSGIAGGTYTVTVTDAQGCTVTASYTVAEPAALTSSIAGTNVTCFGASNGAADLTVSGGTTPYTYLWNNFQASQDLNNISGGTYYVIITDANGCTKRDSIVITEPTQLALTTTTTNILCNGGATGAVDLTVTGATPGYTYLWSNGTTTQDLNAVAAGTYTVTVTDANGCTATASATLTQPAALVMNATTVNVTCAGGANGSVDITVQGGVFPYTYLWSNGATTEDVNALSGGTYTVTITDANGCTIGNSYTITEPTPLVTTLTGTDLTCHGAANGTTDLTVSGGTAPYTYLWNTFQTTQDLSGLNGSTYYVIVTDANGCTKHDSIVIFEPTQIVASTTVVNVLCNGSNTGSVDLTVSGGTPTYTYLWSNGATTEDLNAVAAGTYNVTVTDANGCTVTATATVTQPTALVVSGTTQNVHCFGGADGSVNLSVYGAVLPYTFVWSNSATTEDITLLIAGTYNVTVTDANGCTATASFTITEPSAITSSVVGTDVTCYAAHNGAANLTVSGGVTPYTFFWSNFQVSEDLTNLDGGTYYVVITDANGCTKRDSVVIAEPNPLILSYTSSNISCFNANDGAVDVTVTGGTTPYTYLWSNGATTEDLSGLPGGTYGLTVTDANGCTATISMLIINPSPISANFITTQPSCNSLTDGTIDLIPTGGTPGYNFNWSTSDVTEDVTGVGAGTYTVTITDTKGCVKIDSTTIGEPAPLVTSGFITNVTCFGYHDGFIDITAYGGTLPYLYNWSPTSSSTEDIADLSGGNYFVTVTDANGCTVSSLYPVLEPAQLTVNLASNNIACFGGNNGAVAAIPGGGLTPYEYLWDDFSTDSARTGLTAGKYAILLTDSNGCHVVDSVILTQPTEISITGVVTNATCNASSTGAVNITVNNGTPTYTFAWSNGATAEDIANVPATTYTVSVTDANGCLKTKDFTVTEPTAMSTQLLTDNPSCHGSHNGSASVIATEGIAPYTFAWNTTPVQTTGSAHNLGAGTYTVTVTDANGCTVEDNVTITQPDSIAVSTQSFGSKCYNTSTGVVIATVTGGEAPYIYSLNGVTQLSDTFTNLSPGNYIIEATDLNGCSGTATFTIANASEISVDLSYVGNNVILTGMETQLVAVATSTSPIIAYSWNPDTLFDFSACGDPSNCANPYVHPNETTLFTVTVMNSDSCTASDTLTIYVSHELSAFIPSAFTPNGDGLNDRFEFDILGAEKLEVSVFDRWGGRIFYNANQPNGLTGSNGWDGTKGGTNVPDDTYVYMLKVTYFDGNTKDITGTVTIMR